MAVSLFSFISRSFASYCFVYKLLFCVFVISVVAAWFLFNMQREGPIKSVVADTSLAASCG